MAAVIAHATTTRAVHGSVPARVVGASLSAIGTAWALIGIGLFASHGDVEALLPGLSPAQIDTALTTLGWSASIFVSVTAVVHTAIVVATAISAAFILWNGRATLFHAVLATTLVLFIATATCAVAGWEDAVPAVATAAMGVTAVASGAFFSLTAVFPTGTFVPRWSIVIPIAWTALIAFSLVVPWWEEGPGWVIAAFSALAVALVVAGIVAQVIRFRRFSDRTERQQTKWVLLALVAYLVSLLPILVVPPGALEALSGPVGVGVRLGRGIVIGILLALVPIAIAFAIAKYRLFDVDLVIRRTVVAVTLVVLIAVLYAAIVGGAALLWQGSGLVAAVIATIVAALLAHPLRVLLQRRANRWLYGARGDPYGVVSRLGDDLRTARTGRAVAERVVDVIVDDLRYSWAALDVRAGSVRVVRGDEAAREVARVALSHDGTALGALVIGAAPGDRMSAAGQRLVAAVAAQAELALGAAAALDAVRQSRERLLIAREEEKQRLYRDLHDGLGPALAGARQRIDTAMQVREAHPDASIRLLTEASAEMSGMLADVRDLVHGLRPPALEELGLAGALESALRPLDVDGAPTLSVAAPAIALPPAVEVAAFRIAVEAATNAVRHAAAHSVRVSVTASEAEVTVEVVDDGRGIRSSFEGRGRRSMRERTDELGGTLTILDASPGTIVRARFPLPTVDA